MRAFFTLALTGVLAGCQSGSRIVGDWSGNLGFSTINLTFDPSGSYKSVVGADRDGGVRVTGHYKMDGNAVTLTPQSVELPKGVPDGNKAALLRPVRYSITWMGDKSMKLSSVREAIELKKP